MRPAYPKKKSAALFALLIGVPLFILFLPFLAIGLLGHLVSKVVINLVAWCWWFPRGRSVLLVYSDSVIWKQYFESQVLPVVKDKVLVLNWSGRKRWRPSIASWAFHHYAGRVDFNPAAFVFRPFRKVEVLRFYLPFKEFKRGDTAKVDELTARLFALSETRAKEVA
jgi:hypothetical protein